MKAAPLLHKPQATPQTSVFAPDRAKLPQGQRLLIQPKLVLGPIDDPFEREADHIAAQVMRMPAPNAPVGAGPRQISRKCSACAEGEEQKLQTKPSGGVGADHAGEPALNGVHEVLNSPGQPLDPGARHFMEPRFGHDFSAIRIHTGEQAAQSARSVGALAYTYGSHIVFADGRYEPGSVSGRHLLAHELTHTIQQQSTKLRRATDEGTLGVSPEDARDSEPLEQEGDAEAPQEENSSSLVPVAAKRDPAIQRKLSTCPPYDGYSMPRMISSFNCAGLAHRTYDFKQLAATKTLLAGGTGTPCGTACSAGKVKHWLWEYDIHLEDSSGNAGPTWRDFHTVAGVSTGADPTDVYTKNGKRAVHGPGTGPSFKPPPRDQATKNQPDEAPMTDVSGQPIFKVRPNIAESCYCLNCPSTAPPEAGPPTPEKP